MADRREFLGSICKAAGFVIAGNLFLDTALLKTVAAAPLAGNDSIVVKIAEHDELKAAGGAVVLDAPSGKIILARTSDTAYSALSAVCTHKGCTVDYDGDNKALNCPCHGSQFGLDGSVTEGPASTPLKTYPTTFADGVVTVWLSGMPASAPTDSTAVKVVPAVKDPAPQDSTKK